MIRLRLERRPESSVALQILVPILSVVLALLLCAVLVAMAGANVWEAYGILFLSNFGSVWDIQDMLIKAAPLLFTGLAVIVAFRAKFWNIGAEGQFLAGAVAAAWVGERMWLPAFSLIPLAILGGALFGAIWAFLPALMKVRLKVDDVVSTLLLNFIIIYGVSALLTTVWKDPRGNYPNSPSIRYEAELPMIPGTSLHIGIVLALIAALAVAWMMRRTTLGFSIRAVGENPVAAAYGGMPVGRVILSAALISGALAGIAGACEVGGVRYQVTNDFSSNYGYTGIVIAMLAELNPIGAIPAALFFAAIFNGAGSMARATDVPVFLAQVIQGVTLLTMVGGRLFVSYRLRVGRHA